MSGTTIDIVGLIRGLAELGAVIVAIIAALKAGNARDEARNILKTIHNINQQQTQSVNVPITILVGQGETFPSPNLSDAVAETPPEAVPPAVPPEETTQ